MAALPKRYQKSMPEMTVIVRKKNEKSMKGLLPKGPLYDIFALRVFLVFARWIQPPRESGHAREIQQKKISGEVRSSLPEALNAQHRGFHQAIAGNAFVASPFKEAVTLGYHVRPLRKSSTGVLAGNQPLIPRRDRHFRSGRFCRGFCIKGRTFLFTIGGLTVVFIVAFRLFLQVRVGTRCRTS